MADPVPAPVKKPGYKTSEFWVTVASIVGTLVATSVANLPDAEAIGIAGGLALAYNVGRVAVKIASAFFHSAGVDRDAE